MIILINESTEAEEYLLDLSNVNYQGYVPLVAQGLTGAEKIDILFSIKGVIFENLNVDGELKKLTAQNNAVILNAGLFYKFSKTVTVNPVTLAVRK